MTFHIKYNMSSENRNTAQDRFKKTGALPPEGVTMKGRWHNVQGSCGFIIADTDNIEALGKWVQDWSDVLSFEVSAVLTDEQVGKIIS